MAGAFAAQMVALVGVTVLMVIGFLFALGSQLGPQDTQALLPRLLPFMQGNLIYILGVTQIVTIAYSLLAIRLRHRPDGIRRLGLRLPAPGHWVLVALLMPPLWLLCNSLQSYMVRFFPQSGQQLDELFNSLSTASLPLLIAVVGVGPALGEELLFRGLIGRGLIARGGFVGGITVTSVLFGLMHVNPAQAVGVVPLGIAMHYVYLTTRSFWAPVTFHFCNNALSVILLKHDDVVELQSGMQAGIPWHAMTIASAMVLAVVILLWQTRVRYVLPDGSIWDPGFASSAVPPTELGARAERQSPRQILLLGGAVNSLGFLIVLWQLSRFALEVR
jgi:membrane protease YdiL (CAAX protease family)